MFFPNKVKNLHTHASAGKKGKKPLQRPTAEQRDKHATRERSTGPGGKLPAIRRDRSKTKVGKGQMRNTQDPDVPFHEILAGEIGIPMYHGLIKSRYT